jgi:ligand-binding sensor domain-containing protein
MRQALESMSCRSAMESRICWVQKSVDDEWTIFADKSVWKTRVQMSSVSNTLIILKLGSDRGQLFLFGLKVVAVLHFPVSRAV